MAEISWAENCLVSPRYSTSIRGSPLWSTTLKGQVWVSFFTLGSSKRRPIKRLLTAKKLLAPEEPQFGTECGGGDILGVKNSVSWVKSGLILCSITNQALLLSEGNERWGNSVSLLVGNCNPNIRTRSHKL